MPRHALGSKSKNKVYFAKDSEAETVKELLNMLLEDEEVKVGDAVVVWAETGPKHVRRPNQHVIWGTYVRQKNKFVRAGDHGDRPTSRGYDGYRCRLYEIAQTGGFITYNIW